MVVAEFSVFPIGKGESLSRHVARVTRVIRRSGLPNLLTPMSTVVEGSLGEVLGLVRACVRALERDCPRISLSVQLDIRRGRAPRMAHKVRVVEALVASSRRTGRRRRSN
jgi:uncharacterized protein (TIGR00106 family)